MADAWELGMFRRNGAVFHSRLTGNDGDVITLASSSRGFRLRLKSMPVVFTIDCSGMTSEAQVWERYLAVTQLGYGGHFGCNLDAFNDALGGGPGWPGPCQLRFVGCASLHNRRVCDALVRIAQAHAGGDVDIDLID